MQNPVSQLNERPRQTPLTRARHRPIIGIASLLAGWPLYGQSQPDTKLEYPASQAANRPRCASGGVLSDRTFAAVLDQQFSALMNPGSSGVPGNFLAVDASDALVAVAQTIVSGNGTALTLRMRGGATDGISAVVSGGRLNARLSATAQVHFLAGELRALTYTPSSCSAMEAAILRAEAAHALRMAEIRADSADVRQRIVRSELARKARGIDEALRPLSGVLTSAADSLKRDSLQVERARVSAQQAWQDSIVRVPRATEIRLATNARNDAYTSAVRLLEIAGRTFAWWSLGATVDNSRFVLFDPAAAASRQLTDSSFASRFLTITYSRLTQSPFPRSSRYLAVTARAGWESNLAELAKTEVVDRTPVIATTSDRYTENRTTAYRGAYRDNIATFGIQMDYYAFLATRNRFALHLFPSYSVGVGRPGSIGAGTGLLVSFPRADKPSSRANAEVFFAISDLANARSSSQSAWQRGTLGLRVTFPLNFIPGA